MLTKIKQVKMKFVSSFGLMFLCLVIYLSTISQSLAQSANNLAKSQKGKNVGKDRYFSKSYGEVQFNKYRGQLPPKGTMINCAIDCLSLATCHCIGLNIQTSECHFYGLEESPPYDAWKSENVNTGASTFLTFSTNNANWTNRDYIFFTRDIFLDDSFDKVDISVGRKVLTSWALEQNLMDSKKPKGKGKDSPKSAKAKSKKGKIMDDKAFSLPWIQIEFKESTYITEILLQTTKEKGSELKHFQIRVGNESIAKFYESPESGLEEIEEGGPNWSNAKPFERNNICFEHRTGSTSAGYFSSGYVKNQGLIQKTAKCQPCGLAGRFITIQSMEPCSKCKPLQANQTVETDPKATKLAKNKSGSTTPVQQYPIPLVSIQVYGYVIGAKGRE